MASREQRSVSEVPEGQRAVAAAWQESGDDTPASDETEFTFDGLTSLQIFEMREAFKIFDKEGEGYIDASKLGRVMQYLGRNPTEAEIQDLIESVDEDGNGQIDFEEFITMMSKRMREHTKDEEIKEAFKVFDRNNQGVITITEIAHVMGSIGQNFSPEELADMLEAADIDGDRQVTYNDFLAVFKDDC